MSVAQACRCVGLVRSAYCQVPAPWAERDADIIAALATLVKGLPKPGIGEAYAWPKPCSRT